MKKLIIALDDLTKLTITRIDNNGLKTTTSYSSGWAVLAVIIVLAVKKLVIG